jgi:hypothetical protein
LDEARESITKPGAGKHETSHVDKRNAVSNRGVEQQAAHHESAPNDAHEQPQKAVGLAASPPQFERGKNEQWRKCHHGNQKQTLRENQRI